MILPRLTVIGAGVSGLTVARLLAPHFETTVLEKSRRLSGRCATLLFRGLLLDHGAPYFTLCDRTHAYLSPILRELLVPAPGAIYPPLPSQPYYVRPCANALGDRLAAGVPHLNIRVGTRVERAHPSANLSLDSGGPMPPADAVLCTIPLPQAAALYPDLVDVSKADQKYAPALLAALAYPEGSVPDDGVYARAFDSSVPLSFATRESMKPGRALAEGKSTENSREGDVVFLAHGSDEFSRRNLEEDPYTWLPKLQEALESMWPGLRGARCVESFAKRWRYAQVVDGAAANCLRKGTSDGGPVYFAGDAAESRSGIDVALLSGASAAQRIAADFGVELEKCAILDSTKDRASNM